MIGSVPAADILEKPGLSGSLSAVLHVAPTRKQFKSPLRMRPFRHELTARYADGGTRDAEIAKMIFSFNFLLRGQKVKNTRPPGECIETIIPATSLGEITEDDAD